MCSSHTNHASARKDTASSKNEDATRLFIQDNGQDLVCSYCGIHFLIRSCEDLATARYVQRQLAIGIRARGGPFCCPECHHAIVEGKVKYCIQCGIHIALGNYCSLECAIAFCED
jgi:hypothetical protein